MAIDSLPLFFFFNDTATTEIYTLSLHDALPISPVFLPGESQGQGSLVGCRLWGHTESDTTEVTSLSRTGEGNGNPLQCSCLENPRDRAAWWAAVYGVTQSRTRLR